jgi:UPF0176 protein
MNVPIEHWDEFDAFLQAIPEFSGVPYKFAVAETDTVSFYKLTVKVRPRIVADGIDDPAFDPTKTGGYLSAREFNEYVDNPEAVIVDMRNAYESEIGHFERALTPDVDTFREELSVVPALLQGKESAPIALYCTGGIRCEKASAWLKHQGFTNVKHLKGGIIDYRHQVEQEKLPNRFRGTNFVFDERLGERIGDEVISTCHLCEHVKTDQYRHCRNQACHVLHLACDRCAQDRGGYCSVRCRVFDALPERLKKWLTRNAYQQKSVQYKKRRLRSHTAITQS